MSDIKDMYDMINEIIHRGQTKYAYNAGYIQAINDFIECMHKDDLSDFVDPYEIGGFMEYLDIAANNLMNALDKNS